MRHSIHPALLMLPLLVASCATVKPAVDDGVKVNQDTKVSCTRHCETLGMKLGAIVLIQNSAGCVCEPVDGSAEVPARASSGAGAVTGGALIALEQERTRKRAEEQRLREEEEQRRREDEDRRRREDEERERRDAEQRERDRARRS